MCSLKDHITRYETVIYQIIGIIKRVVFKVYVSKDFTLQKRETIMFQTEDLNEQKHFQAWINYPSVKQKYPVDKLNYNLQNIFEKKKILSSNMD